MARTRHAYTVAVSMIVTNFTIGECRHLEARAIFPALKEAVQEMNVCDDLDDTIFSNKMW